MRDPGNEVGVNGEGVGRQKKCEEEGKGTPAIRTGRALGAYCISRTGVSWTGLAKRGLIWLQGIATAITSCNFAVQKCKSGKD